MVQLIDLTGQPFGHQVVLAQGPPRSNGSAQWWVQCDCGGEARLVPGHALRSGKSKSCGCGINESPQGPTPIDRAGETWGEWTVVATLPKAKVHVRCSCGFEAERSYHTLRSGNSKSCGHPFGWNRVAVPRRETKATSEEAKRNMRELRTRKAAFIQQYKMERGCQDCGLHPPYPIMLSYDHLPQFVKEFDLSKASSYSWPRIHAEIAKCEVVCLNCHAIRTAERLLA